MGENWLVTLHQIPGKFTYGIYIIRRNPSNSGTLVYHGINKIKRYNVGDTIPPVLELTPEILQQLVDELSDTGFKPKQGFLEGKLEAQSNHLADMRSLVFKNGKPTKKTE